MGNFNFTKSMEATVPLTTTMNASCHYLYYEISAMKIILKSDRSISALLKYLERKGKDCILLCYMDIRELGRTKRAYLKQQIHEIRSRYDISQYNGSHSSWQADVWISVNVTLPCGSNDIVAADLQASLSQAESYCLTLLILEFREYVDSPEFTAMYEFKPYINKTISATVVLDNDLKIKYKHVLIIDDSFTNSQLMTNLMEAHGHRVCQANHGRVGAYLAAINHFDVIFIDLSMTTMNPCEVVKRIRMSQQSICSPETYNQSALPHRHPPTIIGWEKESGQHNLRNYGICCICAPQITSSYVLCDRTLNLMLREFYHIVSLKNEIDLYSRYSKRDNLGLSFNSDIGGIAF